MALGLLSLSLTLDTFLGGLSTCNFKKRDQHQASRSSCGTTQHNRQQDIQREIQRHSQSQIMHTMQIKHNLEWRHIIKTEFQWSLDEWLATSDKRRRPVRLQSDPVLQVQLLQPQWGNSFMDTWWTARTRQVIPLTPVCPLTFTSHSKRCLGDILLQQVQTTWF